MGTFHKGKHELHGMTVVVDTAGAKVYVGRCDDIDSTRVVLMGVEEYDETSGGLSKKEFVLRAARNGFDGKVRKVILPASEIRSVTLLGEIIPS